MGMRWKEEMDRRWETYKEETTSWEILHEEPGFEDLGFMADEEISDLDGQETHMHFHSARPKSQREH